MTVLLRIRPATLIGLAGGVFASYLGLATYAQLSGGPWLPPELSQLVFVMLAIAFVASVMCAIAVWLNAQADRRAQRAEERTRWLDQRAEERAKRSLVWTRVVATHPVRRADPEQDTDAIRTARAQHTHNRPRPNWNVPSGEIRALLAGNYPMVDDDDSGAVS